MHINSIWLLAICLVTDMAVPLGFCDRGNESKIVHTPQYSEELAIFEQCRRFLGQDTPYDGIPTLILSKPSSIHVCRT